jgi:hypothetical protein
VRPRALEIQALGPATWRCHTEVPTTPLVHTPLESLAQTSYSRNIPGRYKTEPYPCFNRYNNNRIRKSYPSTFHTAEFYLDMSQLLVANGSNYIKIITRLA